MLGWELAGDVVGRSWARPPGNPLSSLDQLRRCPRDVGLFLGDRCLGHVSQEGGVPREKVMRLDQTRAASISWGQ